VPCLIIKLCKKKVDYEYYLVLCKPEDGFHECSYFIEQRTQEKLPREWYEEDKE